MRDKQSWLAWLTIYEVSRSILRAKLKVTNQEERLQKRKRYFKNLFGNPPEITDKLSKKINCQPDINLAQFTEELDTIQKSYKPKWNTFWSMEDKKTWQHTSSIMQWHLWIEKWMKGYILSFRKKGDLRITK